MKCLHDGLLPTDARHVRACAACYWDRIDPDGRMEAIAVLLAASRRGAPYGVAAAAAEAADLVEAVMRELHRRWTV